MKSVLKKIFSLMWLLLFLQSALEVNACGIENTFNDEYDSYILVSGVETPVPSSYQSGLDSFFAIPDIKFSIFENILFTQRHLNFTEIQFRHIYPPPLNILHSVWII